MNLTHQFRRLTFAQILLGIVAFCIAAQSPGMLLVAGAVAALSWYVTEGPTGHPLPRVVTNIAAMVVVTWLLSQLWLYHNGLLDDLVVTMGYFVMWLQIVLLYREKINREYGEILILSGMLMVAASILSASIVYGLLLALYCVLALATALLYQLKTSREGVRQANQQAVPIDRRVALPEEVAGRGYRWQFRTVGGVLGMGCAVLAVLMFVLMPRRPDADVLSRYQNRFASHRQVGFNSQVNLGRGGLNASASSGEVVLNFKITEDGRNIGGEDQHFLLRGAVMDRYYPESRTWRRSDVAVARDHGTLMNPRYQEVASNPVVSLAELPGDVPLREAEITLRSSDTNVLFTPYPLPARLASDSLERLRFNELDQQLQASLRGGAVSYRLYLPRTPLDDLQQRYADVLHHPAGRFRPTYRSRRRPRSIENYARGWPVQSQRVRRYAESVLAEYNLSRDPEADHTPQDAAIAGALAQHLVEEFQYTLDNPPLEHGRDPVIHFLFREPRGHCELFAAAHAAMCRSLGMPARLVTGYRATEYNRLGDYYVVRQKNAHAWSEVYLGPGVEWRQFDPTPSAEVSAEHSPGSGWFSELRQVYDYVDATWVAWVVAYDPKTRRALLDEARDSIVAPARKSEHWVGHVISQIRELPNRWQPSYLTYVVMAFFAVGLGLAVLILTRTIILRRRRLAALQLTALPRARRRKLARRLRFYIYMLELLERHGHVRPRWQSPQAFAQELAEVDPMCFDPAVALTELFYEVRFGYREVDADRRQRIRAHLRQLEYTLAEMGG